jgi:alpha-tubulin suppressor-like RCC1 family protein
VASGCTKNPDCPPDHFCGAGSKTCVSAVAQVVAGAYHSCALHKDGTVTCWGLAESIFGGGRSVAPPRPIDGVAHPLALAAGTHLTCALTADRFVRCWGNQQYDVVKEDGTPLSNVTRIAVGSSFACAANPEGVHCWGKNGAGQLARPLDVQESSRAVLAVAGGARFLGAGEAVVTHDGGQKICGWGDNRSKVVTAEDAVTVYDKPQCGTVTDVVDLAVGSEHACVLHPAGTIACWGERYYGQLGIGGDDTADVAPYGADTSLAAPVVALAAGASHTCALLGTGAVVCFGLNSKGQVGPGADTAAEEVRNPAAVTGFAGRVTGLGAGSSAQHSCAIIDDGSAQCWGSDLAGQLGDGVISVDEMRFSHGPVMVRW